MTNFLPHTDAIRQAMLERIGVHSIEALFSDIPLEIREAVHYRLLPRLGLSEQELEKALSDFAADNPASQMACFLGGGAYSRFIPMAVQTIATRSEFYTAYTPYQPEIAQGTLQVTYEFQSMISELTGMDVANASVYDGASALTEAALMAMRITKRSTVAIARSVHPDYRDVLKTYLDGLGGTTLFEFDPYNPLPLDAFCRPITDLACIIIQVPNYCGGLEPVDSLREICQKTGALLVVSAEPVSLGLLEAPGQYGADIVTGDIQPLGNALSFGGPYGGYMATKSQYVRQLPGRLVGRTTDKDGQICYTLTLQAREQHIRREKATSNICTNQALNVLKATVYLSLLGPRGLKELALLSMQRMHDLANRLLKLPGISLYQPSQPFLFECALRFPVPTEPLLTFLAEQNILGGIPLDTVYPDAGNVLLITCTETTLPEHMDAYVTAVETFLNDGVGINTEFNLLPLGEKVPRRGG